MNKLLSISLFTLLTTTAIADTATDKCIKNKVAMKETIEQKNFDSVQNSFFTIIPGYKEQLEKQLEDPYSCSLAWVNNKQSKGE